MIRRLLRSVLTLLFVSTAAFAQLAVHEAQDVPAPIAVPPVFRPVPPVAPNETAPVARRLPPFALKPTTLATQAGPTWWTHGTVATGYIKLVTPIVPTETNFFSIKIVGYGYSYGSDAIEIRCGGYAYSAQGLIAAECDTNGTDLPVWIGEEDRAGSRLVVIRLGLPTTSWYYPHFTADYLGWHAKTPESFQWVIGETTPVSAGNMNGVVTDDVAGKLTATGKIGVGTTAPETPVDVYHAGNSIVRARGGYAGLLLESGNGQTSSHFSFVDFTSRDAAPYTFRLGMTGNKLFTLTTPGGETKLVVDAGGNATVYGNLSALGNIAAKYQDVAEWVPSTDDLEAGAVVVLDTTAENQVTMARGAYDTRVAGVVSVQPGIILGEAGEGKEQIATTGRVLVNVDATRAPVAVGDLLVTSDRPGFAMKSLPLAVGGAEIHRPGTIIGKALQPLPKGTGQILVLLSMQ